MRGVRALRRSNTHNLRRISMINLSQSKSTTDRISTMKHLTGWICKNYGYKDPLTHLKLQKLFFYCYGALLSQNLEQTVGADLVFEPWDHGPVNRELYNHFRYKGANPLQPQDYPEAVEFPNEVEYLLQNTLDIYGAMSAWSLRQQTHTEKPWVKAYDQKETQIDPENLKIFFQEKFASGTVEAPEYLFGLSSFQIDGIPIQTYGNLQQLASEVRRVFSELKN